MESGSNWLLFKILHWRSVWSSLFHNCKCQLQTTEADLRFMTMKWVCYKDTWGNAPPWGSEAALETSQSIHPSQWICFSSLCWPFSTSFFCPLTTSACMSPLAYFSVPPYITAHQLCFHCLPLCSLSLCTNVISPGYLFMTGHSINQWTVCRLPAIVSHCHLWATQW